MVPREMGLDILHSDYGVEVVTWGHVGGAINVWADALSRLAAPEPEPMPAGLADIEPTEVPTRVQEWWRASGGPEAIGKEALRRRSGKGRKWKQARDLGRAVLDRSTGPSEIPP